MIAIGIIVVEEMMFMMTLKSKSTAYIFAKILLFTGAAMQVTHSWSFNRRFRCLDVEFNYFAPHQFP